MQSKY